MWYIKFLSVAEREKNELIHTIEGVIINGEVFVTMRFPHLVMLVKSHCYDFDRGSQWLTREFIVIAEYEFTSHP